MTNPRTKSSISIEPAAFPHLARKWTTGEIMRDVLIALFPVIMGAAHFKGLRSLLVMIVSLAACVACEAAVCFLRKRPLTLSDGSAAVTGLLLALTLPLETPLPAVAVGSAFAILIVKFLFGGLGRNFLNPALAGGVAISLLWPEIVPLPGSEAAGDLFILFSQGSSASGAALGEGPAMLLLAGAAYLYLRGVITLTAPLAFLGSATLLLWIFSGERLFAGDPSLQLMSGGLLLAAFFLVTDYTTTPVTRIGRLVFGLGAGLLAAVFRLEAGIGAGIAILAMNAMTPLIERLTRPRPSGTGGYRHEKPV